MKSKMWLMAKIRKIRFSHDLKAGTHVITSPDVRGLYATGGTLEEAQRVAAIMVREIRSIRTRNRESASSTEAGRRAKLTA
jgi:hypothetical protein